MKSRGPVRPRVPTTALSLLILLWAGAWAPAAWAEPLRFRIVPEQSELTVHATSRLMDADGTFGRFSGEVTVDPQDLTTAKVNVTVDAASIDTGIGRRDRHLRSEDFFHVERFPTVTFESVRVEGAGRRVIVVGRLTLRGVTREMIVPVEVSIAGGRLEARGSLDIRRSDHAITYRSFMNPIGEMVRIVFTFRAVAP